jgi:DNA repair protein RecO (recombination protein O)
MTTFRTESIVLKKEPWREYDRLYTLFTRDAGKLRVIAKGSRRSLSRMAAHLEPFLVSKVMIARGRQIDKLAGSEQIINYRNLDRSLGKIALLNYCFEVLDQMTSYGQPDVRIFDLAQELLDILDKKFLSNRQSLVLARIFSLKLLGILGYDPELGACLKCKSAVSDELIFFNFIRGGVICRSCGANKTDHGQIGVSLTVINMLRQFIAAELGQASETEVGDDCFKPLDLVVDEFLKYHLDYQVKSEKYFYQVFA